MNRTRSTRNNKGAENKSSRSSRKSKTVVRTMMGLQIIENGSVVANAMYNILGHKFHIVNIYVDEGHRGQGNGKKVLKELLKIAFSNPSITSVELTDETQSDQFNPTRIPNNMYNNSGFVHSGKPGPYHKNDKILTRDTYLSQTLQSRYLNSP
jgi:predicted GNAT family acetyltransferase